MKNTNETIRNYHIPTINDINKQYSSSDTDTERNAIFGCLYCFFCITKIKVECRYKA